MTNITLFPHQVKGAKFLASKKFAGLFAGMGTGKTLTSLEAVDRVGLDRAIIIAPPIALPMWRDEVNSYLGLHNVQILKTGKAKIDTNAWIIVVSYQIATTRKDELREWLRGGILICDESHALKSHKAKRTKAILGKGGIVEGAGHAWMLTGTPITRWNDDMYPFLVRADMNGMRDRLQGVTMERFQMKFTVRQKRQFGGARFPTMMVVGNRNTDQLANWVYDGGHAMRFDLDDVFKDMPPLTTNRYTIQLAADPSLKAALKELERSSIAEIRKKLEAKEPALATVRRQMGLAKVKGAVAEIKERIDSGQNVLVGAWHTDVIDALRDELSGYASGAIDGRSTAYAREDVTKAWNEGQVQVLIGQIAAMGVSLNLQQGGSQIIVVEEDWSPSVMDQFYARLWRFGQEKHVHVDILQSDTKLDKALGRISSTKAAQHARFNKIGKEVTDERQ